MAVTTARLARDELARLPAASRPLVVGARPGIVHLGLGAFHRAHQAVYTEEALAAAGGDWGIVAVAPRSRAVVDAVNAQDGLFSVTTLSDAEPVTRVIGALAGARHLPSSGPEILDLLADPAVRVVTLTVTEKAYLLDAAGRLLDDPALRADLTTDRPPSTVVGLLARALRRRAAAGGAPLAVVSCDNLPDNGARLRSVLQQALGDELGGWVSFPRTMVDRIVPASTDRTTERAGAALGLLDLAAVDAEPWRQWVLEDDFPGGRPAWEAGGAVFSADVAAYERLKLRVLNGVHSTLAYLGALAGRATIADAIDVPGMPAFLGRLITADILPTLRVPAGVDGESYARAVLARFANRAIGHRTIQVAMDGSQKLPQRLLATVTDRRAAGADPIQLALSLAGWIRFLGGRADDGAPLEIDDPLGEALRATLADAGSDAAAVRGVLGLVAPGSQGSGSQGSGRPGGLVEDDDFVALVADQLGRLRRHGVAATLAGEF